MFTSIYQFFRKQKKSYYFLIFALLMLSVFVLKDIRLNDDIRKVLPHNPKLEKTQSLLDGLKVLDKLVVVFSSEDSLNTKPLITMADAFVDSLEDVQIENVRNVRYRFEQDKMQKMYRFFYQHLPLFLDSSDYELMARSISPESIDKTVEANYKTLVSPAGIGAKRFLLKDPFSWTPIALKKLQKFSSGDDFLILNERLFSSDQKNLFVFIDTDAKNQKANGILVELLEQFRQKSADQGIRMHYFGASPVAFANQKQIKQDIWFTVGFAFILVILFISLFFRSWKVFLNVLSPVVLGASLSLSILILFWGEISALALGVGSILLGITIDYALHIYTHLLHESDKKKVLKAVYEPILLSSFTTAVAFVVLVNIQSEAFTHLAWFAALSVISVAVLSLIMIPQQATIKTKTQQNRRLDAFLNHLNLPKMLVLILIPLVSLVLAFGVPKVQFEGDLLKLNYLSPTLEEDQEYINKLTTSSQKDIYLSAIGADMEEALHNNERAIEKLKTLKKAGLISDYASLSSLWHSKAEQSKRLEQWKAFWQKHHPDSLKQALINSGKRFNFNAKAFRQFFEWLNQDFSTIEHSDMQDLRALAFDELITESEEVQLLNIIRMRSASSDQIQEVYRAFETEEQLIPFDKQYFREILLDGLKSNFSNLIWWSMLFVFLILLLYYGRIELAIINMLPILISWLWTLGLAGWLNIEFNIFNVIISSLIFGLGIDYSIAITQGMILEYKTGQKSLNSFRLSVLFSALTTLAGVGVLIFAKHPALKSMAVITIIGMASVLFLSYTLIPLLFNFLTQTQGKRRKQPVRLLSLVMSNLSLFLVWLAMLFSLPFRLILSILPISKTRKKNAFSYFVHILSKWVVYMNFHIPKHLIGFSKNYFDTPSIIIANHQSQLDLVFMLMLHPKMIVLTNQDVWNHRILKYFVRYADFYPVPNGLENAREHIQTKMQQGYSVLIFPEGTRTDNGKIKRFHKGAFQLALDLKAPILPILIYGAYEALNRHEFFLHPSTIYIQALEKININEAQWGDTLRDKTKSVQILMRTAFENLRQESDICTFQRKEILAQFIYKGPVLEWYAKIKTKIEDDYQLFNNIIAKDAEIVDIGCGYGFLPYYLAKIEPQRKLTGYDYDADKIAVAQKASEMMPNLQFDVLDIVQGLEHPADVFILADILHYMPEAMQKTALNVCLENLNLGGMIIVRDANAEMKQKHQMTKLTEFFSTKVLRFNKTQDDSKQLYFITKERLVSFLPENQVDISVLEASKYLSNIVYLIQKK